MGRAIRKHIPGSLHHVMLRGNNGEKIFLSDEDRCRFCLSIQYGVERFDHQIDAFCLMDNHVHLALRVHSASLSTVVHNLASRYARYFNSKYDRIGHVFQGRFKSLLVQGAIYLQTLVRYIHLNPIRAGLASLPEGYKWSSHRAYLDLDQVPWLHRRVVLNTFDGISESKLSAYNRYVNAGIGRTPEVELEQGVKFGIVGSTEFIAEHKKPLCAGNSPQIELEDVVEEACSLFGVELRDLSLNIRDRKFSYVRGLIALVAREFGCGSYGDVARFFNRTPNALQKVCERVFQRYLSESNVQEDFSLLKGALSSDLRS